MTSKFQSSFPQHRSVGGVVVASALAAVMLIAAATESSAQIVKRGVQGGLLGAGVGALVGGGKGAGKGALIGAGVGAVVGIAEKDAHARPAPRPRHPPAPVPYQPGYGLVYNIQTSLTRLGYDPGPIDGRFGRRTGDAIAAYEYNNQLPVTGQPSASLHQHMVQNGG
ncbi:MAG: peptidoglycan-binding protein [Hyphomicrobiales bacterium]|nr:peptidoglycan-binding protein [Hyphomicrobiales bacterium]